MINSFRRHWSGFASENSRGAWALLRLVQCIRGPKLRRLNFEGRSPEGRKYEPNKLEKYADNVITAVRVVCSIALYTTPLYLLYYCIRYGTPSVDSVVGTARNVSFIPLSFSLAYIIRGIGRFRNGTYMEFLRTLNSARNLTSKMGPKEEKLTGISAYDFNIIALPVTFSCNDSSVRPRKLSSMRRKSIWEKIMNFPFSSLRFIAAHLVGRRLIYPGSLSLLNAVLSSARSAGRAKMKRMCSGFRARLLAADGNSIDCMFVDKRGSPDVRANGNKVVICCEGNAAYYELGMMEVPLNNGYSVIGWNHPGFGDSTGLPFPTQEFNAVDVVVRYLVTEQGFAFEDIIVYAWSIGGYTASCVAMSYPDIGAVVIDASFDELYPLVAARIHPLLHEFCRGMVQEYYNLNVAEQLCRYQGPVRLIRRMRDEMMAVNKDPESNRANYLLIELLKTRYPRIVTDETLPTLWKWLSAPSFEEQVLITSSMYMRRQDLSKALQLHMAEYGPSYPWDIGEDMSLNEKKNMLLFLAEQYMGNVDTTHCIPLPVEEFVVPSSGNFRITD